MEEIKKLNRQKRGQVSEKEVKQYENATVGELTILLNSNDPKSRTIAAILIGNKRILEMIPLLCKCLVTEKSLYSRIAMSEALGRMGEPAVLPLISLLGKIGNNQETELPEKYCEKKSYPLARDMSARTLVKIGKPAIPGLIMKIKSGDSFETQQAIDAIGGIVSKTHDKRPLSILLEMFVDYSDNEVTIWKIIRALSAFKHIEATEPLIKMLINHTKPSIRWEAARSIGQIGISTPEVIHALQNALQDQNSEVRKAAKISLEQLK
jgi:HEAT repeat protein